MSSDSRRDRQLGIITQNLQRFEAYKAADMHDAVVNGVCPFCGEGPFQVVARHTYLKHDIRSRELREMLGFLARESICDPAHARAVASRSVLANPEVAQRSITTRRNGVTGTKMTPAARSRMSARRIGRLPKGLTPVPTVVFDCVTCGKSVTRTAAQQSWRRTETCSISCGASLRERLKRVGAA